MAMLVCLNEHRPPKLTHVDGEPVKEIPGLVYYQDCPIHEDVWFDLLVRETNGWLSGAA